jgi:hypothetical protein
MRSSVVIPARTVSNALSTTRKCLWATWGQAVETARKAGARKHLSSTRDMVGTVGGVRKSGTLHTLCTRLVLVVIHSRNALNKPVSAVVLPITHRTNNNEYKFNSLILTYIEEAS